jgi:preprotein translocase subunit SecD
VAVSQHTYARRALISLAVIIVALGALLAGAHEWGTAGLAPKLGLDLEGGTQMILTPRVTSGKTASPEQISQARDIIVQRVDANGVAGAEVTTQNNTNIVVSIPGVPDKATLDAIRRSSQLQFRAVLAEESAAPLPTPTTTPSGTASPSGSGTGTSTSTTTQTPAASARPSQSGTASRSRVRTAATPTPSGSATATSSPSPSAAASPGATPTDPTSPSWVTPAILAQFQDLKCSDPNAVGNIADNPDQPLVTCDQTGSEKYILGPVIVSGQRITDATAGYQSNSTGQVTSTVEIQLSLDSQGAKEYGDISTKMVGLPDPSTITDPATPSARNQLAATLDSRVIIAPRFVSAILDGRASITGGFTLTEAKALAQQLKFGALPLSFDLQTQQQISPTLGSEQLRYGLLAGLVGLLLVVIYSLFQYRALGSVTVASILVSGLMTYLSITILGWSHNYRLDMAGVTGLIVAIGFTADSFIVYFERVRDELREGRSLASAVETGWARAKRTILAADGVNFLAAFVLYLLASANVRGFAFTLGLTTVLDLVIVFLFTHPMVATLARRPFFRDGHPWSGLDPRRLGAKPTRYAGRGRFVPATPRVASSEGSQA